MKTRPLVTQPQKIKAEAWVRREGKMTNDPTKSAEVDPLFPQGGWGERGDSLPKQKFASVLLKNRRKSQEGEAALLR